MRIRHLLSIGKKPTKKKSILTIVTQEMSKLRRKKEQIKSLDDLILIKGIGRETLKDIKRIYHNVDELKSALAKDKVPLRNDIVKKLKKKLIR